MDNDNQSARDTLAQQLKEAQEENQKMKYELHIQLSKESLHKSTMDRVKQIQDDYEKAYQEAYHDFKEREAKIKEQYQHYSNKLQSEYSTREERLIEQMKDLKAQIQSKSEALSKQQSDLMEIIEKNAQNEIAFHLKEKDYEEIILSKERKQAELEQAVKSISMEASEKIQSLSKQLDLFQSKIQNTITLDDDFEHEGGYATATRRDLLMTSNDINPSLRSLDCSPSKKGKCPNDCITKLSEKEREIYSLRIENERLLAESIEKDKEIEFWKGMKQELKQSNHSTMANNYYSIRSNYLETRRQDNDDRYNELKSDHASSYLKQAEDINEIKEQYQPHQYSYHQSEPIPLAMKYKKITPYPIKPIQAQRSGVNRAEMRHQEYNYNSKASVRTLDNGFNESTLALKQDTSMKELNVKIKALRAKLKA